MRALDCHGRPLLSLVSLLAAACLVVGCPSEPEIDPDRDAGPQDDADDADDSDVSIPLDIEFVQTPPDEVFVGADRETTLEFEVETSGCDHCQLRCGFDEADDACSADDAHTFSELEGDIEGERTFVVEATDGQSGDAESVDHPVEVLFEFNADIEGLDSPTTVEHPYLGEFDVTCEHPNCETTCHWETPDTAVDIDCPTDETLDFQEAYSEVFDDTIYEETTLVLTASSTAVDDHEETTEYDIETAAPAWETVDAGGAHTCGILESDGTLWCFGDNNRDQLGVDGGDATTARMVGLEDAELSDLEWTTASAGAEHTCAVAGGEVYCWGNDADDRLGHDQDDATHPVPVETDNDETWVAVDAGGMHTCGITDAEELYCWGRNQSGQLGIGDDSIDSTETPTLVESNDIDGWDAVSTGEEHTCGIALDETVYCWGDADDGRLGNGDSDGNRNEPSSINNSVAGQDLTGSSRITTGSEHSCVIANTEGADVSAYCWGQNEDEQLGTFSSSQSVVPVSIDGSGNYENISAGNEHTCATDDNGKVFCWGLRLNGRLGDGAELTDGSSTGDPETVEALDDSNVIHISAGGSHTCAISDTTLHCWGQGSDGQLGDGDTDSQSTAVPIDWPYAATE